MYMVAIPFPRLRFFLAGPVLALMFGCAAAPDTTIDPSHVATGPAVDGYAALDFDLLSSFPFVLPPNDSAPPPPGARPYSVAEQMPAEIKKLDGQKVRLTGYMQAPRLEQGLVVEFKLARNPSPYSGFEPMPYLPDPPRMNEQVLVQLATGVKPTKDTPISCYGTLHVRGMYQSGFLVSIYQLAADQVLDAK
jgi:hypothetical protein